MRAHIYIRIYNIYDLSSCICNSRYLLRENLDRNYCLNIDLARVSPHGCSHAHLGRTGRPRGINQPFSHRFYKSRLIIKIDASGGGISCLIYLSNVICNSCILKRMDKFHINEHK